MNQTTWDMGSGVDLAHAIDALLGHLRKALAVQVIAGDGVIQDMLSNFRDDLAAMGADSGWLAVGSGWDSYEQALAAAAGIAATVDGLLLPEALDILALAAPRLEQGEGVRAAEARPVYLRDTVAWRT